MMKKSEENHPTKKETEDDETKNHRQEQLTRVCTLPHASPEMVKCVLQEMSATTIAATTSRSGDDDKESLLWKLISAVHAQNTNTNHAEEIVKLLCRHFFHHHFDCFVGDTSQKDLTRNNFSLLHRACASSAIPPSTVQTQILEHGSSSSSSASLLVNGRDQDGRTPLHLICTRAHWTNHQKLTNAMEKARILLQAGADSSAANAVTQDTPLHVMCQHDYWCSKRVAGMDEEERQSFLQQEQKLLQLLLPQHGGAPVNTMNAQQKTPLLLACGATLCNGQTIASLLTAGANVNVRDDRYETPLHAFLKYSFVSIKDGGDIPAASSRSSSTQQPREGDPGLEIVHMLVAAGADLKARDASGRTPLWYCVQNSYHHHHDKANWTRALLEAGANPTAPGPQGRRTLLHAACETVQPAVVQALIEFGAHLNVLDDNGLSPLFLAIRAGAKECIQSLVQAGVHIICPATNYPIHYLCDGQEDVEVLRLLLQGGVKVDAVDEGEQTPLLVASGRGRLEAMQALLDFGANVNATDSNQRTPLHKACQGNFCHAARLLLQHGANVNAPDILGRTPVDESCSSSQVELLQMLVQEFQANVNVAGRKPPLLVACESHNVRGVEILLENGADINAAGMDGETALHVACRRIDLNEFIPVLLSRGANANALDHAGRTPLITACRGSHTQNVELLFSSFRRRRRRRRHDDDDNEGENLNWGLDHQGNSALHYACQHGNFRLVQILLARGARVSLRDQQGHTPFQVATCQGFASVTYYLLQQNGSLRGL